MVREFFQYISRDFNVSYNREFTLFSFIKSYIFSLQFRVVVRYRFQSYIVKHNRSFFRVVASLIRNGSTKKYGVEISNNSLIGPGLHIHHIGGIVIGNGVIVGENLNLFHNVTLGSKGNEYPIIGHNVTIYTGTTIIGAIKVGDNVVIGANSIITKDIPDNSVVVGKNEVIKRTSSYENVHE